MSIQIPTHFRFKKSKDAKEWFGTTKDWHCISDIQVKGDYYSFASTEFAWVDVPFSELDKRLEFKFDAKAAKEDL